MNQDKVERSPISHSRPTLGPEEARAVSEVIESGYIAEGQFVKKFERTFADFFEVDFAVCTNSGT